MLANSVKVQPVATRPRLALGAEARHGSLDSSSIKSLSLLRRGLVTAMLLGSALQAGIIPQSDAGPVLLVHPAGAGLADDLPILVSPESRQVAAVTTETALPPTLVPQVVIHRGPPKQRWPADPTAQWMFGLGLLLFWVSWLLAVLDRPPRTYRRPLFEGEDPPRPNPPHIVYSLPRSR